MYSRPLKGANLLKGLTYLLLWATIFPGGLFSGTTGKITGRVIDAQTGAPLASVNLILEETTLGDATNEDGTFMILRIPPGTYTLVASMIGYHDYRLQDVRVQVDLTTRIEIPLTRSEIEFQEITVTAHRPLVQPDVTYSQQNVSAEEIEALPVEEFEDMVSLQAGVVVGTNGALHIRGGRSSEITYLVDGIPVTDPFNKGMGVEIENNAIQELQVISGTFNAEYGQAMSGVINIITKEGSYQTYHGNLDVNGGDYLSDDSDLYMNINDLKPLSIRDIQGTFSGPLLFLPGSFFVYGRSYYDEGYLYGQRRYKPDSYIWNDSLKSYVFHSYGDWNYQSMSWVNQISLQGKLNLKLTSRTNLAVNHTESRTRYRAYNHKFRYNPEGDYHRFRDNQSTIFKLEHTFSSRSFLIGWYASTLNRAYYYVYKDPVDSRYNVNPAVFNVAPGYKFYVSGIRMGHYNRQTETQTFKLDYVKQLNRLHQLRTGVELRKTMITQQQFTIQYNENTDYQPVVPDPTSTQHDKYRQKPVEFAAYVQDKIEYDDLVLNIGLRFDYFDPQWKVLSDPADPNYRQPLKPVNQYFDLNGDGTISQSEMRPDNKKSDADRLEYWFKPVNPKEQYSPRLAVAFPISDKGVLHFAYGHFFQIPQFSYLYVNSDFEVTPGLSTTMGNADLEPERTTQYEVGIKQQIGRDIGIDITGFYKDIRNLLSTRILDTFIAGDRYALYVNRDYGSVRGITFSLSQRPRGLVSGSLDYTYSIAEGNASDPAAAYYDALDGVEPEKQLVALDWDQRHTLSGTVTFHLSPRNGISLIGQFGSGLPYTPAFAGTRISYENSERKPAQFNVDLRSYWGFSLGKATLQLHVNIYNLFDRRNEIIVYTDTGRATYSLIPTYLPEDQGYNTLSEYLNRPDYFSPPRQVKIGLSLSI